MSCSIKVKDFTVPQGSSNYYIIKIPFLWLSAWFYLSCLSVFLFVCLLFSSHKAQDRPLSKRVFFSLFLLKASFSVPVEQTSWLQSSASLLPSPSLWSLPTPAPLTVPKLTTYHVSTRTKVLLFSITSKLLVPETDGAQCIYWMLNKYLLN